MAKSKKKPLIRIPIGKPTKAHKTKKSYKRKQLPVNKITPELDSKVVEDLTIQYDDGIKEDEEGNYIFPEDDPDDDFWWK